MRNKKHKFANKIVVSAVFAIALYTVISFAVQYHTGTQPSDALTYSYFTFWTIELIKLADIKKTKLKTNYTSSYTENVEKNESDTDHNSNQESESDFIYDNTEEQYVGNNSL